MQETHACIYCVVDLHAITVFQDPQELAGNIREVTAAYLACGLDPKRSIIFNQSQVSAHAELAWVFNCVARLGWLNRMTQFKEKAGKDRENASVGLYAYPNLMAADILAYRATHVPVGEDQKQHLELARDIAQKFNNDFAGSIAAHGHGDAFFPLPEPMITGPATRVMSLRDGTKKMSKSDPSDNSRINLTDDADTIAAEDPQGEDRPRAAALRGRRPRRRGRRPTTSSASMPRSPARRRPPCCREFGGAQFSALQAGALRPRRGEAGADRRRDARGCWPIPATSTASSPTAPRAPAPSPRRSWTRSRTSSALLRRRRAPRLPALAPSMAACRA